MQWFGNFVRQYIELSFRLDVDVMDTEAIYLFCRNQSTSWPRTWLPSPNAAEAELRYSDELHDKSL